MAEEKTAELMAALRKRGLAIHIHDTPINRALTENLALAGAAEPKPVLVAGDELQPTLIVCALCDDDHPLMLLDNQVADCVGCGRRIQFRPDCPSGPRHCVPCALALVEVPP